MNRAIRVVALEAGLNPSCFETVILDIIAESCSMYLLRGSETQCLKEDTCRNYVS